MMNFKIIARKPILLLNILLFLFSNLVTGQPPSHDPTHMVKDGSRYYIFTTGDGIWNMSASNSDFSDWQTESLVFSSGTWPGWINSYVPGFEGFFWAPEIIYMNGAWHLYYSCSTWGSQNSAIGVVTTPSLVSRTWNDQGMVVYTTSSSDHNAIDPGLFKDNEGKVWMTYGSYWSGIVMTELDSITGKPVNPGNLYYVANNSCEASNVLVHGSYYYLFFNRGACCSGIHSTYHILMGRSINPTGPFYDKDSVSTNNGGGSLFLHSDGFFIGPGHFGYGEGKLTYHYYDGLAGGAAKLKIGTIEWEDNWPVAVYSRGGSPAEGNYVIANYSSSKVLQLENADTVNGMNVAQYTETGDTSQHWNFSYIGNGYYKISPVLAPDKALEVEDCSTSDGANIQIGKYEGKDCQHWYIANMGSGVYRIMASHSRKAIEIGQGSAIEGANARQNSYSDNRTYQRWRLKEPTDIDLIISNSREQRGFSIYPNPSDGSFTLDLTRLAGSSIISLEIYSIEGKRIFNRNYTNTKTIAFTNLLNSGMYFVKISNGNRMVTQKLIVK